MMNLFCNLSKGYFNEATINIQYMYVYIKFNSVTARRQNRLTIALPQNIHTIDNIYEYNAVITHIWIFAPACLGLSLLNSYLFIVPRQ